MADALIIATPLTSPLGLNNWTPDTVVPLGLGIRGPPLEIGVGSVIKSFIWTMPPGGADSSGTCRETWRPTTPGPPLVPVVEGVEPPLVDPLVFVPDVWPMSPWIRISEHAPRMAQRNFVLKFKISSFDGCPQSAVDAINGCQFSA
jgi:hypothetical protein